LERCTVVALIWSEGSTLEGRGEEVVEREGEGGRVETDKDEIGEGVEHL